MKNVLTAGFLLLNLVIFAQTQLPTALGDVYYAMDLYDEEYHSPEGSPYLNKEFAPAKINEIRETKLVRFDAYEGRIEVMANAAQVIILNNSEIFRVSLLDGSDRIFETHGYIDEKGNSKHSFFEKLESRDEFKLYLKEKVKYFKSKKAQAYKAGEPAQFRKVKGTYYIIDFKSNSGKLIGIPQSKKEFVAFFGKHSKDIKNFMKDNKIKINNKEDLLKVFDFYFELR